MLAFIWWWHHLLGFHDDGVWCHLGFHGWFSMTMDSKRHPLPWLQLERTPHVHGRPSPSLWMLDVTTCVASMIAFLHFYDLYMLLEGSAPLIIWFSLVMWTNALGLPHIKRLVLGYFIVITSLTLVWGNTLEKFVIPASLALFSYALCLKEDFCGCYSLSWMDIFCN